jgi:hypothetical protein
MKTEDQEERKRKRLEAETLKKFPYFKSIQFAVFNVNENDIRKGRKAVIAKYGPAALEKNELRNACRLVENVCRSLGKDCQVIFTDKLVSVAPPEWAGDSTGVTLFDAIQDALK